MEMERFAPRQTSCNLNGIRQLQDLAPETVDALNVICQSRHYSAGQTVVFDGEHAAFIGCVKTGFLRMQKTLGDGRQHIVGLLVEGDMFGRVFDGPLHFGIEAATDTEICAFQRAPFEDLLTRAPDLERVVLLNILNELDRARDWMIILSNQKVSARVAGFLLIMCRRFVGIDHILQARETTLEVKIPISRPDLAHLLGTRPESISRAFHALADQGCIEILNPNLMRILDAGALAVEAGDEELAESFNLDDLIQSLKYSGT